MGDTRAPEAVEIPGMATILLVEDNDAVRAVVARMLDEQGFELLIASGSDEALAHCRAHGERIDLVLSDLVMPRTSGEELVANLRRRFPRLRVLFMSGYLDSTLASVAHVYREHGRVELLGPGTHLLRKPFTKDQLADAVQQALAA
jgi:two-component system, cell cycle sensor histidine kinase and response regulator CckA